MMADKLSKLQRAVLLEMRAVVQLIKRNAAIRQSEIVRRTKSSQGGVAAALKVLIELDYVVPVDLSKSKNDRRHDCIFINKPKAFYQLTAKGLKYDFTGS